MPDLTPDLAELRRLLDVNRERDFHALPWHAWDRGIGYELHVGATCRYEMEPRGYCEEVNNGFRETFGAPEAELIVAAVNALPALLDAAAERDALAAAVERVRALHIAHDCTSHAGIATICAHRPGICLACLKPLPCPTIRALDTTPDTGGES